MTVQKAIDVLESIASGSSLSNTQQPPGVDITLPYIKDWHLVLQSRDLESPDDRMPYHVPDIFADDCTCPFIDTKIRNIMIEVRCALC